MQRRGSVVKRKGLLVGLVVAILATGVLALSGCVTVNSTPKPDTASTAEPVNPAPVETTPTIEFTVSQSVAAKWTDGALYKAEVIGVQGDQVTVKYVDDQSTMTVPAADVRPILMRTWVLGEKVQAVWTKARFYMGEISEVLESSYMVKWDDGSAPSEVASDSIIAR